MVSPSVTIERSTLTLGALTASDCVEFYKVKSLPQESSGDGKAILEWFLGAEGESSRISQFVDRIQTLRV